MRYFLLALLFAISIAIYADVFMNTDQDGNVTYSDIPTSPNAKRVDIPDNTTTSTTTVVEKETTTTKNNAEPIPNLEAQGIGKRKLYTSFAIKYPQDQETFQNQPIIPIDLEIQPELQEGDTVQVFLDGQPWGIPLRSSHVDLQNVYRGQHSVSASLLDQRGNPLRQSQVITIYVHQAHLGDNPITH